MHGSMILLGEIGTETGPLHFTPFGNGKRSDSICLSNQEEDHIKLDQWFNFII